MIDSAAHSFCGYVPRSALDGLLPVHPLVLDEVPATLRASTLILKSPRRRCPPAASPRSGTGGWSGWDGGASNGPLSYPSQPPRIQSPSHSRHASRRIFRMPIRATPAASRLPRRHEAPGATQSVGQRPFSSLRRDTLWAPEGHPLRAENLGTDCPSFSIKVGSNQNAPRGPDTLATDMLGEGPRGPDTPQGGGPRGPDTPQEGGPRGPGTVVLYPRGFPHPDG